MSSNLLLRFLIQMKWLLCVYSWCIPANTGLYFERYDPSARRSHIQQDSTTRERNSKTIFNMVSWRFGRRLALNRNLHLNGTCKALKSKRELEYQFPVFWTNRISVGKWNLFKVCTREFQDENRLTYYYVLADSEILILSWWWLRRMLKAGIIEPTAPRPMHSLTIRKRSAAKTWHKFRWCVSQSALAHMGQ